MRSLLPWFLISHLWFAWVQPVSAQSYETASSGTSSTTLDPATNTSAAKPRRWYGPWLIATDVLGFAITGIGVGINDDSVLALGLVTVITDGLIAHASVGMVDSDPRGLMRGLGKGLLSVAMRGAAATGLCFAGSGCHELSDGAVLRMSVGVALAAAVDAAWLAYWPAEESARSSFQLTPMVARTRAGASVGYRF